MLQKGKLEESKAMFKNLVESELLQKIDNDVRDLKARVDDALSWAQREALADGTPSL